MSDDIKIKSKKKDNNKTNKDKEDKIPLHKKIWFDILVFGIMYLLGVYILFKYWKSYNLEYDITSLVFFILMSMIYFTTFIFLRVTKLLGKYKQEQESSYTTNVTPLEKKYKEIDEKVKEWRKSYEELVAIFYDCNYQSEPAELEDREKMNEIEEEVYRLSETYMKHKVLVKLAYDMAKYEKNYNADKYKNLLIDIDKEELKKLQSPETILKFQQQKLSQVYKEKTSKLRKSNIIFIIGFLVISVLYAGLLIFLFRDENLPSNEDLLAFIITKTTLTITFSLLVFWVARFFNRRIHENVHLIEEYEHKSLLLETFDILTQSANTSEHKKEILDKVIITLLKNPTYCLSKKKADELPTEIMKALKIINPNL